MRHTFIALALMGGCQLPPEKQSETGPSQVIEYDTIDMGLSIAFKVDPCLTTVAQDGLDGAQTLLAHYGITLTYNDTAKFYMRCSTAPATPGALGAKTTANEGVVFNLDFMTDFPTVYKTHAVAHEVGHMLGALHVPSPNSLMWPVDSPIDHLTEDDVESIEERGFLDHGI